MPAAELVFDDFDYQGGRPSTLRKGDVYSVRMVDEADSKSVKDVPLFVRDHLVHQGVQFQFFFAGEKLFPTESRVERRILYVTGPPGCGKTAFTTLVAHGYAAQNKRVLMILFRQKIACQIFIIDGNKTQRLNKPVHNKNIFHILDKLLEDEENIPPFDLCILDGVRDSLEVCNDLIQLLTMNTGKKSRIQRDVFTTSLQFQLKTGDMDQGSNRILEKIKFDSFTRDDYIEAIANPTFFERLLDSQPAIKNEILLRWKEENESDDADTDVSVDAFLTEREGGAAALDYVKDKYYYAGGSARYMFEYTTLEVKTMLRELFGQVPQEDWNCFAQSTLSTKATTAVNSLMQQFKGYATAVSRYVLFEAYDKVGGRLVEAVQIAANESDNPALKGWAFELKQLHKIKTVLQNNSRDGNPAKTLHSKEGLCFRPVKGMQTSFDGNALNSKLDLTSGTIIWCMKWNQGCFDVAFFKASTLLTLQFTVAKDHSLKVQYIKALKSAIEKCGFKVDTLIHVGVVDADDTLNAFRFKPPEGVGRSTIGECDFTLKTYISSELVETEVTEMGVAEECLEAKHLGDIRVYPTKRALSAK